MAKTTFHHLSVEKQQQILAVCKKEFEHHPIGEAKVSNIVKTLGIARGSFYQYFEDIEECYFTVLEAETTETHELFSDILAKESDLFLALDAYGLRLAKELFLPERYALYRNRYLFWTPVLEEKWKAFCAKEKRNSGITARNLNWNNLDVASPKELPELISYLKAIVHELIRRMFTEEMSPDDFLNTYRMQMKWLKKGVEKNKGE